MYNDILSIGKTIIECQSLDVVIFSLLLIGKNWQDYIIEAKRCLSTRGSLFIAVTTKELDEGRRLHSLPNVLKDNGFFIDTKEERGDFSFMEGIKI
jgi:hypothetical protein